MRRCLFIDGSGVIRKVAKRILGGTDMMVTEAGAGLEALELCAIQIPDVIVVAHALPDMDAPEFIRQLRAIDRERKCQVLVSMNEVDIGIIMRAKRAGADGYLLKPFNRPQLIERFRSLQVAA
jgi:two-component system, chemotaxis family, chemotaxis protein CheY